MQYDIAIIGAGPGGYDTALYAAKLGYRVVLIERDLIGGTCLNYGCIPTKILLASAKNYKAIKSASDFGIKIADHSFTLSYSDIKSRKDNILTTQRKAITTMLAKAGVTMLKGSARFEGVNTLIVDNSPITATNIIIATGTTPADVGIVKIDNKLVLSSDSLLDLQDLPESMLILGGGVMGCEFAFILAEFGVNITIIEQQSTILPLEDEEISSLLIREMKKAGIKVIVGTSINRMELMEQSVTAHTSSGLAYSAARMLVTVGRKKQTNNLNLEAVDICLGSDGGVPVNDQMQTIHKNIFAVGDVTGKKMVAHVATEQGRVVLDYLCGNLRSIDYANVPSAIFTIPEIGCVGLTEKMAKANGVDYLIKKFLYRGLGKAHAEDEIIGFFKIIADKQSEKIIGAHFVGQHASDIIMEAAIAIKAGLSYNELSSVVHPHPTYSEGVKLSLLD